MEGVGGGVGCGKGFEHLGAVFGGEGGFKGIDGFVGGERVAFELGGEADVNVYDWRAVFEAGFEG